MTQDEKYQLAVKFREATQCENTLKEVEKELRVPYPKFNFIKRKLRKFLIYNKDKVRFTKSCGDAALRKLFHIKKKARVHIVPKEERKKIGRPITPLHVSRKCRGCGGKLQLSRWLTCVTCLPDLPQECFFDQYQWSGPALV